MKKNIFQIFIMLYLLFPFSLNPLHSVQKGIYYFAVLCSLVILAFKFIRIKINRRSAQFIFLFIICFTFLFFLTIFIPFFYLTDDFSYFLTIFDYILKCFILSTLALVCNSVEDFLFTFSKATAMYVIFSIILLFPPIRLVYTNLVFSVETDASDFIESQGILFYTRYGLQGFSGFEHTFKCSLAFIFLIYLLTQTSIKKQKIKIFFLMILNFVGCCFYGRVGILSCCLTFIFYTFYVAIKQKQYKILTFIIIVVVLFISTFLILFEQITSNPITNWMFEPFIKLVEDGKLESASSDGLKTMYFLPSIDTFLFGDGYYSQNGHYYMRTDVGYLRPLLFWGIFGSLIYYLCFFILLVPIYNSLKNKKGDFLVFLCIFQNFFYEIKGETNLVFIALLFSINIIILSKNMSKHKFLLYIKKMMFKLPKENHGE